MKYSSELIQTMRDALEAVMATVPADQPVIGLKAAVAQFILQTAVHGQRLRVHASALCSIWYL
jgi:hypothetical protein